MSQIAVAATITAKAGSEARVEQVLRGLVAPSREDRGCIRYVLHRSLDDPRIFMFLEAWESRALLQAHLETEHIVSWRAEAPALIEGMDVKVLEELA